MQPPVVSSNYGDLWRSKELHSSVAVQSSVNCPLVKMSWILSVCSRWFSCKKKNYHLPYIVHATDTESWIALKTEGHKMIIVTSWRKKKVLYKPHKINPMTKHQFSVSEIITITIIMIMNNNRAVLMIFRLNEWSMTRSLLIALDRANHGWSKRYSAFQWCPVVTDYSLAI